MSSWRKERSRGVCAGPSCAYAMRKMMSYLRCSRDRQMQATRGHLYLKGVGAAERTFWTVVLGEPEAMELLGQQLSAEVYADAVDLPRAARLFREAAELGDMHAQFSMGISSGIGLCEQLDWLRRSALQCADYSRAFECLVGMAKEEDGELDNGGGDVTGRTLFEIGSTIAQIADWEKRAKGASVAWVVEFFEQRRSAARRAVLCWLWLSRIEGVAKDIRLLIADLIWAERAMWGYSDAP